MVFTETSCRHVFYHADRAGSLKEYQEIILDESNLSYFGKVYWSAFQSKRVEEMEPAQQREYFLHQIKQEPRYSLYSSRLQSIFAANSITEAIVFANTLNPKPNHPIPIIEIYADRFWTLDSNWLDYDGGANQFEYYRNYWDGIISNHRSETGERRPPRLEVMIALPAITGKIVHIVERNQD